MTKKSVIKEENIGRILPNNKSLTTSGGFRLVESEGMGEGNGFYPFSYRQVDVYSAPRNLTLGVLGPNFKKHELTAPEYIGYFEAQPFFDGATLLNKTALGTFHFREGASLSKEERFDVLKTLAECRIWVEPKALEDFAGGKGELNEFAVKSNAEVLNAGGKSGYVFLCKPVEPRKVEGPDKVNKNKDKVLE